MTLASHWYLTLIAFGIQRRKSILTSSSFYHKGGDNQMPVLRSLCEPRLVHTWAFSLLLWDHVDNTRALSGGGTHLL